VGIPDYEKPRAEAHGISQELPAATLCLHDGVRWYPDARACRFAGMSHFVIALVIVATILVGGLVKLLRSRRDPMGSPEVLDRVKQRERELQAREDRDGN
jgi:hypothetical protein